MHRIVLILSVLAAAAAAAKHRDVPWLLGYFLDNELSWGGETRNRDEGMFDTAMSKPADHPARIAAEEFVAARSHGASARSAALREPSPTMKRDFLAFVAERYFGTMAAAIRRHDPNHMVLGCRFAGMGASDVVLKAAGRHCDIVTFNCYPWADLDRGVMLTRKDGPPLVDAFREFHEKSPTPPSRRCSRGCTPPAHRYGSPIPGMRLSAASPARRGQRPHPR